MIQISSFCLSAYLKLMRRRCRLAAHLSIITLGVLLGHFHSHAQVPSVSLRNPDAVLLGESATIKLGIDNTDTDLIGFDPIVELILPSLPNDGEEGIFPDVPTLAFEIVQATYLGNPIHAQFVGHFDSETGTLVNPLTEEEVTGLAGSGLYILHYPLSSISPNQPVPLLEVDVRVHPLTPIEPHFIEASGIFNYGNDPTGSSRAIYGSSDTGSLTPSLLEVRKTVSYAESETATGPSFPGTWKLVGDVAREASLQDVSFSDELPDNFLITSASIVRPAGGVLILSGSNPGQTLSASWDSVSGSSQNAKSEILIQITGHFPETDGSGNAVLQPSTGEGVSTNQFSAAYTFERSGIEPEGGLTNQINSNQIRVDALSLALQKSATLVNDQLPNGLSPSDTVEFILDLQVSDFKEVEEVRIDNGDTTAAGLLAEADILGDALSFDASFVPTYEVSMGDQTVQGTLDASNFSVSPDPVGYLKGTSLITFDLSQQLIDDGRFGSDGILTGARRLAIPSSNGTTARIRYRASIDETFDSPLSGDESVDITDRVENEVDAVGFDLVDQILVGDESSEVLQMLPLSINHLIERIVTTEGIVINKPAGIPDVSPGDVVTFSIGFSMPTGDVEDLKLNDFFPYSMFDVNDVNGDGFLGDTPRFNPVVKTYPGVGEVSFGPLDEFQTSYPLNDLPNFSFSIINNSISLDYGSFDSPEVVDSDNNGIYEFELRVTLVAGVDNLPDGFKMTSLVQLEHGSTNAGQQDRREYTGLFFSKSVPVLTKGVIESGNPDAVIFPLPTGNYNKAGSDGDLIDANAGDLVRFAVTLQNTGSDPISEFELRDLLPPEFNKSQARILSVNRADGVPLIMTPPIDSVAGSADEDALFGSGLFLNSSVTGNYLTDGSSQGSSYGSESLVLVLEAPIIDSISPDLQFENTVTARVWYAEDVPVDGPYIEVTDSALIQTEPIRIEKTMVHNLYGDEPSTTSVEVDGEIIDRATIGEVVTFDIELEVPQGVSSNVMLSDNLPSGLGFIPVNGVQARVLSMESPVSSSNLSAGATDANNAYIKVNNGSVIFDFGMLSRPLNGNDSPKSIVVRLYTYVQDTGTNTRGTELTNTAFVNWTGGSASDSASLTIARPNLLLEKNITPAQPGGKIQGGTSMLVELNLSNIGGEVQTSAGHDFVIEDLIQSRFFDVSTISEVTTPEGFGFSTEGEAEGVRVLYSAPNIEPGAEYYFSFTVDVVSDITLPVTLENLATATGTSLPVIPPSGVESEETGDDLALSRTARPTVSKSLISSSENYTSDRPFRLTIGERAVYRLRVDVPEGTIPPLTLTDRVPNGMDFVGINPDPLMSFPGKGFVIGGPMGEQMQALLQNVKDPDPTTDSSLTTDGNGRDVRFEFGSITNLPDGDDSNDYFILDLELVVLDRPATIGYGDQATKLKNRAKVFCEGMQSREGLSKNVTATVVEPWIRIAKEILEPSVDGGDLFTVEITLKNVGGSDAFGVVVEDVIDSSYFKTDQIVLDPTIPNGWSVSLVPSALEIGSDTIVRIASDLGKKFIPGTELVFRFFVPVEDEILAPSIITNTATVSQFTSLHSNKDYPADISGRLSGGMSATADINISNSVINLSIVSTSETDTAQLDGLSTLTFGERAIIRVDVDLPDGTINNPAFVLELPPGLDFVGNNPDPLLTYPGLGFDGFYGTFGSIAAEAFQSVVDPDSSPSESMMMDGSGLDVSFVFDSFVNSPDGNPDNDDFHFFIEVVSMDEIGLSGVGGLPDRLTASMRMDAGSGYVGEVSSPLSFTVAEPFLAIEKTMSLLGEADQIGVTIIVSNSGNSPAHDVRIDDLLDPSFFNTASAEATSIPNGFVLTDNEGALTIESTGASIGPGKELSFSFSIEALPDAASTILNTTQIISSSTLNHHLPQPAGIGERTASPVEDVASLDIPQLEAFMKVKDLDFTGEPLKAGDEVEYLVTVRNSGVVPVSTLELTAPIPTHTTYIEGSLRLDGEEVAGPLASSSYDLGTLAPSEVKTVSYQVKVDSILPPEIKKISNSGTVTFAERSTLVVTDNDASGHDPVTDDGIDDPQDSGLVTSDDDPSELYLLQAAVTERSYLAFEDLKNRGWNDWDHNDILLDVTTHYLTDGFSGVESVIVVYQMLARGASYESQVNVTIPYAGDGSWNTIYAEVDGTEISSSVGSNLGLMETTVFSSTKDALPAYTAGKYDWGASRTERFDPTAPGKIGVVTLTLSDPSSNPLESFSKSPHNTWAHIITTGEDIHRVQYKIGNTQSALEGPLAGRSLPFVVEFDEGFNWPSETMAIYDTHPDYVPYIKSGASTNLDWSRSFQNEMVWVDEDGNLPGDDYQLAASKPQEIRYAQMSASAEVESGPWPQFLGGPVFASPVLYDLLDDGRLEILISSMDGQVHLFDADANPLPGWPQMTAAGLRTSPGVGDIDGDKLLDVVVGATDGMVYAWGLNGDLKEGFPVDLGGPIKSVCNVFDISGGPETEIIVHSGDSVLHVLDGSGLALPGWPQSLGGAPDNFDSWILGSSPVVYDLGNGNLQLGVGSTAGKVHLFNVDGSSVSSWPADTGDWVYSSITPVDLVGDSALEVVAGSGDNKLYAWTSQNELLPGFPVTLDGGIVGNVAAADLTGNGDLDLVATTYAGSVYAVDARGRILDGWPRQAQSAIIASPLLVDADGDGSLEVIVASRDNWLYTWRADGSPVPSLTFKSNDWIESTPAAGDIDGDGRIELVYGTYDNSMHVIELDSAANSASLAWPAFLGDRSTVNDDLDDDGIPDTIEMEQHGTLSYSTNDDPDGDGVDNFSEWVAGTNANDSLDSLQLFISREINRQTGESNYLLQWNGRRGRSYEIYMSDGKLGGKAKWDMAKGTTCLYVSEDQPMQCVVPVTADLGGRFFRIKVSMGNSTKQQTPKEVGIR